MAQAGEVLLSVREVAGVLRVCAATVYALCESGELPSIRIAGRNTIRVSSVDLSAFIENRRKVGR